MKQNTFKKIMSAVLSVAMLISMMVMPANAVVLGEDAYSEESTIVRYNFDSGITTPVNVPDYYSMNPGISTHDFLSENELAQVNNAVMPNMIIGDDTRVTVNPTIAPYNGIVLIVRIIDEDGDGDADAIVDGTGFMVSSKIMISAMHVFDDYDTRYPEMTSVETRVYQGVTALAPFNGEDPYTYLNYLSAYSYQRVSDIVYDTRYITATRAGNDEEAFNHDWCIATLQSGITGYYFNCQVPTSSINDMTLAVTGYPSDHSYLMKKATGSIYYFDATLMPYMFKHNVDTMGGQSGSPVYDVATTTCYGIHVRNYNYNDEDLYEAANGARMITQDLLNTILNEIAQS